MTKCQITCKSLQKSSKCQIFQWVWHLVIFRADQLKNHPVERLYVFFPNGDCDLRSASWELDSLFFFFSPLHLLMLTHLNLRYKISVQQINLSEVDLKHRSDGGSQSPIESLQCWRVAQYCARRTSLGCQSCPALHFVTFLFPRTHRCASLNIMLTFHY